MAAPSLAERTWAGDVDEGTTGETSQCTFNYPGTVNSGDRLVAVGSVDGSSGDINPVPPAGWTMLVDGFLGDHLFVMERIADGTETGTAVVTHDAGVSEIWIGHILRITGAHASTASTAVIDATGQGSTSSPDCPASGTVPSGDYLAIAICGAAFGSADFSANPTNYETLSHTDPITSSDTHDNTGGTGGGTSIATAVRQLTGITSEDPGTFSHNQATADNVTATVLVPAAAAGGGTTIPTGRGHARGSRRGSGRAAAFEKINDIWQKPTRILVPVGMELQGA